MTKLFFTIAIAGLIFSGCASPPPRIANTASGRPEVLITNASVETVRNTMVEEFLSAGWRVDSSTELNVVLSKKMAGRDEAGKKYVYGGVPDTFRDEFSFAILKVQNGVKVFAQYAWTRVLSGQTVRTEENSNETFNSQQAALFRLRDKLGGTQ
jgi:hypothetical protein